MLDVHKKRDSDEHVEIVAYLLRHKPIDESDEDALEHQISWLKEELEARQYVNKHYGGNPQNRDYLYIKQEYKRLKAVLQKEEKFFRAQVKVMCMKAVAKARRELENG